MEEEDSKLAFHLQLQEALMASSSSTSTAADLDRAQLERVRLDLSRQIHDRAFALQVATIPEVKRKRTGNNFNNGQGLQFRVYVKGLVGEKSKAGGIGVAICDQNDGLVFQISKGLSESEHKGNEDLIEMKALIEGLHFALMLELKRIKIIFDNPLLYQCMTGKRPQTKANIAGLTHQINHHLRKFTQVKVSLGKHKDVKYALELARKAMALKVSSQSAGNRNSIETCAICFGDTYVDRIFVVTNCLHRYCFSCMSKHARSKLLEGLLPKCPHENCKSVLKLDSCKKLLTSELFNIMSQRVREASIPAMLKIYCPYPRCSYLMSKVNSTVGTEKLGTRKICAKCNGTFCTNCKVPWHSKMTCSEYKRRTPYPSREEMKLRSLAALNSWRQCPTCSAMVSLARGCYHIHCRCGYEFCYKCGAKWSNKKPTCTCPSWEQRNIIY